MRRLSTRPSVQVFVRPTQTNPAKLEDDETFQQQHLFVLISKRSCTLRQQRSCNTDRDGPNKTCVSLHDISCLVNHNRLKSHSLFFKQKYQTSPDNKQKKTKKKNQKKTSNLNTSLSTLGNGDGHFHYFLTFCGPND